MKRDSLWFTNEGYFDPTAGEALTNVSRNKGSRKRRRHKNRLKSRHKGKEMKDEGRFHDGEACIDSGFDTQP